MFKTYDCAHFTSQHHNAQNPSNQASTVCELRTSRCTSWVQKRQRDQRSYCQHLLDHRDWEFQKNIQFCFIDYAKAFDCVDHNKLQKILKIGIPDHLSYPLRNLYAAQEVTEPDMEQLTGSKFGKVCALLFIISFLLPALSLIFSSFYSFLRQKLRSLKLDLYFLIQKFQCYEFPSVY